MTQIGDAELGIVLGRAHSVSCAPTPPAPTGSDRLQAGGGLGYRMPTARFSDFVA